MAAHMTALAKISRPSVAGGVCRKRLFSLLDDMMVKPVIWVSSPAGAGKTTLVSGWLNARGFPCIWYHCDDGDEDLATFFYYMGLAARKASPRHRKPLPLLTPEYLAGIPTFARRFFEKLYDRITPSSPSAEGGVTALLVLDNYQDVPEDSPFHTMIAVALDGIPEGIRVVVVSRTEPPAALARLQANGKMGRLQYGDLRFTLDESVELAHGRVPALDPACIRAIHDKTEGWAAGIILMLESGACNGTVPEAAGGFAYERVFDYFAGEMFNRMEEGEQDFLLKTSIPPVLSVPLAEKLTGAGAAERILSTLHQQHYFTERLSGSGLEYQYHPLFRDFLLNRAQTFFSPDELAAVRKEAALLIEQAGRIEDAARLYCDAGDGDGLARLILGNASKFLAQGRNRTVEEWIAGIPGELKDDTPWLLYWTGMCSFPTDMPRARSFLEKALASFRKEGDAEGGYLSWAGIVDTYAFGLDEWGHLDECIAVFDELGKTWPSFPSREIDLIASSRMLISLTLRKTDRPGLVHRCLRRVSGLLREKPSFPIRMDTLFSMSLYYLWKGEYGKNAVLLEKAEAEIRHSTPSPFVAIRVHLMKGIHYWITAEYDSAVSALSAGLDISEKSGVRVFDSLLWGFRAAAEMASGCVDRAEKSLRNQMTSLLGSEKALDIFFHQVNSAWFALLKGNPSLAAEHLAAVTEQTARMGTPYYRALWNIGMAQTSFLLGRIREAKGHVRAAHRISLTMKSSVLEWYSLLIDAWLLLREGRETDGLLCLRRGLSLGRRHGYVHLEFQQPSVMRFLFARALEEEIEPDYVKWLVRKLGLTPPGPHETTEGPIPYLHGWPYPVRIYTLGRFEILRDDEPIRFSGKEQKRPLELLKALIAFGGRDVPVEHLTDALWPDADGDLAHKSLETALGRLRRLLGNDECIRNRSRLLSLNPLHCWVDSLAMEQLVDAAMETDDDRLDLLCKKAVTLFKGPFLPADTGQMWTLSCRENLKYRLLRVIRRAGRRYEEAGKWDRACEYYVKGIETDGLAEEFYRRLLVCHLHLGNNAEAVTIYNRCRRLLRAELGVEPSSETIAVFSSIKFPPHQ
jgi:DNA-binding SARP family transcriptional activator